MAGVSHTMAYKRPRKTRLEPVWLDTEHWKDCTIFAFQATHKRFMKGGHRKDFELFCVSIIRQLFHWQYRLPIFIANDGSMWIGNNEDEYHKNTGCGTIPVRKADYGIYDRPELSMGRPHGLMYKTRDDPNDHGLFMDYTAIDAGTGNKWTRKETENDLPCSVPAKQWVLKHCAAFNEVKLNQHNCSSLMPAVIM